jgi:hypothetical protein
MGHSDVLLVLLSPRSFSERLGAGARPVHPILRHRSHIKGQSQLLHLSGYGLRVGRDRQSGNAEIRAQSRARQAMPSDSLQQIAEITSRLFDASTAADVNAAFGVRQIAEGRADPKDKPIAVMWEK